MGGLYNSYKLFVISIFQYIRGRKELEEAGFDVIISEFPELTRILK